VDTSFTHIRPRFEYKLLNSPDEAIQNVRNYLETAKDPISYKIAQHHVIIDILETDAHYWSPQLSFRVEVDEFTSEIFVRGLVGPRPAIWTLFNFIYFFLGTIGFFIFCYGAAKWHLSESYNHFLLALPLTLVFMLSALIVSKQGEALGKEQVNLLKGVLVKSLKLELIPES
jgi:hypothetical protein